MSSPGSHGLAGRVAHHVTRDLERVRAGQPLVLSITNYVVTNTTANALLAVGASPIMSHAVEEMEDLVALSRALVVNLGSLFDAYPEAMTVAGREAGRRGVPVVLDPVGMGASRLRVRVTHDLLRDVQFAVIRGNASEILATAGQAAGGKGVDSSHRSEDALDAARTLARATRATVCVSGPVDVITDGEQVVYVHNGHPWMPRVTGLGCTATALVGAFLAVADSPFEAAIDAMVVLGVAGEVAAEHAKGPGSLQVGIYDALHALDAESLRSRLRVSEAS